MLFTKSLDNLAGKAEEKIHRAEELNQDVPGFAPWADFLQRLHNIDSGFGPGCKILRGERHYITIRTAGSAADADVPHTLA